VSSFDNIRHDRLLQNVATRVEDGDILHLLKVILKASGKKGVPQGGGISPLLSDIYLNEVDKMLEAAKLDQSGASRVGELLRYRQLNRVL